jgi:hypothetical protein
MEGKMTRLFTRVIGATVIVFAFASFVLAQDTNDAVKVEMYQRFVDNRLPHPDIAYQAARDYLQKYANDKDKYTEYLGRWTFAYERDERKRNLPVLINQKNFAQAYRVGAQILADEQTTCVRRSIWVTQVISLLQRKTRRTMKSRLPILKKQFKR